MKKEKLLINHIYCNPVGHVVEALKFAKGYKVANKNIDIYLLLNARSTPELAKACPWLKKAYAVDPYQFRQHKSYKEKALALKGIPKTWDYIISDNRAPNYSVENDGWEIRDCYAFTKNHFKAKKGKGFTYDHKDPSAQILPYKPNSHIDIKVPATALKFAERYRYSGPKITMLLAGSGKPERYPSLEAWGEIIRALNKEFPNVRIYLTGYNKISKKTKTRAYTLKRIREFVKHFDNIINCYNIGLWNQLALIKNSDILIAPHTGFAFLAQTVGTPWLEIATWKWPQYLLNNIKFYSVIPDCKRYPCWQEKYNICDKMVKETKRIICMSDKNIKKKTPEIIKGAKLLMDDKFTYQKALSMHLKKVRPSIKSGKLGFLDGVQNL